MVRIYQSVFANREISPYSFNGIALPVLSYCFSFAMWRRLLSLWSSPRVILRQVLALDDTPHAVALGAAVGVLFGMTPTVGLQTIEVILFALITRRLFYFNRAAALTLIYVSNPLTMAAIYYGLYWVGSCFVPGEVTLQQFRQILTFEGFAGSWQALKELVNDVGLPLAVGTLVVAPISAMVTYPLTRCLLQWYRGDDTRGGDPTDRNESLGSGLGNSPKPDILRAKIVELQAPPPVAKATRSLATTD